MEIKQHKFSYSSSCGPVGCGPGSLYFFEAHPFWESANIVFTSSSFLDLTRWTVNCFRRSSWCHGFRFRSVILNYGFSRLESSIQHFFWDFWEKSRPWSAQLYPAYLKRCSKLKSFASWNRAPSQFLKFWHLKIIGSRDLSCCWDFNDGARTAGAAQLKSEAGDSLRNLSIRQYVPRLRFLEQGWKIHSIFLTRNIWTVPKKRRCDCDFQWGIFQHARLDSRHVGRSSFPWSSLRVSLRATKNQWWHLS